MAWYHRLLNMARADRHSRDLDREMAFHLDERADALRATGMNEDDATREARRRFGNRTAQKERTHDADVFAWMESLVADVRYALRTLIASPGFALVAILSLALGIGANTAIFSLTDALVLKSLPVSHPEQLVQVTMGARGGSGFTNPLWEQIRDNAPALSSAFAYSDTRFNLSRGGEVQMTRGAWVSGDFFSTLGVRAEAGRVLQRGDDFRGCPGVAAVSDAFARRQYGDPTNAVGKVLSLNDHPFPVVGVADAGFFGIEVGQTADIYVPLCAQELLFRPGILDARSRWFLNIIGRPKPSLSTQQASAAMATVAAGIFKATLPTDWSTDNQQEYLKNTLSVVPAATGLSELRAQYGRALYILMVVVGVVLLIACANIANLLLARGAARQREISIRMAIGAGRGRLVRQLLTESVLLSLLGAALGVVFAHWATRLLVGLLTTRRQAVWLDLSV
ncbi:MAG TPA: ABC transporter permease, partial [Gemmatimonadaceae bacterium]